MSVFSVDRRTAASALTARSVTSFLSLSYAAAGGHPTTRDDAMRFEPTMAMDSSTMPTEEFQRSYQLRMPGVKHAKPKEKDPLASLLKAMKLGQSTGTKNNRVNGNENKDDDIGSEGSDAVEKSTEKLTLYAR